MSPRIGEDFVRWNPATGGNRTPGLVGFSIFPHVDHEALPENTMADAPSRSSPRALEAVHPLRA